MPSPFPISPVQAAVLGRAAPAATVNASGAAPSVPAPTGQTAVPVATPAAAALGLPQMNGMDQFLLNRANRGGSIDTGVNLLGRLAALGVGRKIQGENQAKQSEAVEAAISALPPEAQAAARIAAISGDPSKILPILQQNAQIAAQTEAREDSQSFQAEQTKAAQSFEADQASIDRDARKREFEQTMGLKGEALDIDRASLANTMRTDAAKLAMQQEELQLKKDEAAAANAAEELDLNESERKGLGFLAQMAEPAQVLRDDFADYEPTELTNSMIKQIAAFGDTSMSGWAKSLISSEFYVNMDDTEKRFYTSALGFAEAVTRKASGATVTGADLAITFGRLINRAGDTPQIRADKQRARDVEIESLIATLPDAAVQKLF